MATMDAQAIFDNFHTHAKGTQGLTAAAQTAQQLAAKYQDRALTTQQMIDTIQSGWQGSAAEAASQGLAPLAENALNNHQQLGTGQDIVSRQVDSFHTAASQVQPVPAAPSMTDVIGAVISGQNPQTMLDQIAHRQATQQSNVDAYNRYVGASQYNTTNVPTLNSLDTSSAPVSVTPPAAPQVSPPSGSTGAPHVAGGSTSTAPARHARVSTPVAAGRVAAPPAASGSGTASGQPTGTGTTTSGAGPVAPPPTVPRPAPVGSPPGSGPIGGVPAPVDPIVPIGGVPPGTGGALPGPGGPRTPPPSTGAPNEDGSGGLRSGSGALPGEGEGSGGSPVGRGGPGALGEGEPVVGGPRPGPGAPVAGGVGSGARETGGVPGEDDGPRTGGRGGAASGVAAEEEAMAAERGVTARPVTSAAGPMLGGRGAKGGEDTEHKRRYGVDVAGEVRFGTDQKVAPPVLGESATEREQRHADEAGRHHRDH